ncbi:M23 family metallopeptidase [Undibacterium fentianense]|uniref:M23 family metallopeptidase n=1 Tax=Undibacterium fentianense TaxID=2828728 RepID=A0A941E4I5_9BURK|nr:M23 family metallopeptidase [Undibacterium fentianense]MBR7799603.1 M23 family metallopeptidase [Undibacterium fentianense]
MQVIIMHSRLTRAKSVTLSSKHLFAFLSAFALLVLLVAFVLMGILGRIASTDSTLMKSILPQAFQASANVSLTGNDKYLKENLNAMAVKIGEMQAQLIRLDALGERVQGLAGVKPEEFNFKEAPARGGAEIVADTAKQDLSLQDFQTALDALSKDLNYRSDYLNVVESKLMSYKLQAKLLPTIVPVNVGYNASTFGRRLDPFSGRTAFHEGLDFSAPTGTPIVAAAGGVVVAAEYHPEFGNMLEIDHGADMITRYAHASKLLAKVGDIVKRGQHIANIGSTGRSTGAHLHFEVRIKGVAQNPHKFLNPGNDRVDHSKLANYYRQLPN